MTSSTPSWGSTGRGTPQPPDASTVLRNARRLQLIRELQEQGHTPAAIFALVQISMKREFPDHA